MHSETMLMKRKGVIEKQRRGASGKWLVVCDNERTVRGTESQISDRKLEIDNVKSPIAKRKLVI
jgi:hypothetical protein